MKFAEFIGAHEHAQKQLKSFEGDDNWPGLTPHDRVYALPCDWQGEDYTVLIRVHRLSKQPSSQIPVEVWHWHWRGGKEAKLDQLSPGQLAAVAEIKRTARCWIEGAIDDLPLSTCRHIQILKEEPR